MTSHKILRSGFGEQAFTIYCHNNDAYDLAAILFADFPGTNAQELPKQYSILATTKKPGFTLLEGEQQLYSGTSRYQLAYILMNEVLYHCIVHNSNQHALHSAAVCLGNHGIILPGASGNGKSTLTAWLVANGYSYLTDELVFLSRDGGILPLTRPINLKVSEEHISWLFRKDASRKQIISDTAGSMIPHRLFNPQFSVKKPQLTHILFPEYKKGSQMMIEEISAAKSCLQLIQCYVNARNFAGHGFSELSALVRNCRSYKLRYGSFDDLETLFNSASSPFLQ